MVTYTTVIIILTAVTIHSRVPQNARKSSYLGGYVDALIRWVSCKNIIEPTREEVN